MAIDLSFKNKRTPRKGRVLIADPFSKDEYFGRSIVYICDHNSEGTFGFVLTNYLDLNLSEVAKNFPNVSANISIGGPVQTESIFFLHTLGDRLPGSIEVDDGIYMGGDNDLITEQLSNGKIDNSKERFFLVNFEWNPVQLKE